MASLVADYGSSSGSDDESEDEQDHCDTTNADLNPKSYVTSEKTYNSDHEKESDDQAGAENIPTMLDNPFRSTVYDNGSSTSGNMTASVFSNPYREAENAEQSVLEKHVKMTPNSVKQTVINGRQVCWNYRKGRCRFGHNCKFAHDSDLPNAGSLPNASPPANAGPTVAMNNVPQLPVSNVVPHNKNHRSVSYEQVNYQVEEEAEDSLTKKKKRPGLGEGLVPSKKVMKAFHRQQQQQRPWLSSRH